MVLLLCDLGKLFLRCKAKCHFLNMAHELVNILLVQQNTLGNQLKGGKM